MYIKIIVILFSIAATSAQARTCGNIFATTSELSTPGLSSENKLYSKFEKAENSKGNVLLIHGLGDDLTHLNKLAANLKKEGFSILRIDLYGHGETLENFAKTKKPIPTVLPYENNVRDISEIIKKLDFKNPIVIGHSYGGAIAYALSNQLKSNKSYRPQRLIMMAPYLRRLDHSLLTGNPLVDMQTEYMSEQFMRSAFRGYFESQKRKNIDLLIDATIASTKGIRSFDILSYDKKASLGFAIPLLIIAGSKDDLVKYDQIENYHKKLLDEGYAHKVVIIDGDHFFPQNHSAETFKVIKENLNLK